MPSRAVLKRKAKKEAKRLRSTHDDEINQPSVVPTSRKRTETAQSDETERGAPKRRRVDDAVPPASLAAAISVASSNHTVMEPSAGVLPPRGITAPAPSTAQRPADAPVLSRKERKRQISQQKHERQLMKLSRSMTAASGALSDGCAADPSVSNSTGHTTAAASTTDPTTLDQAPLRHDPRNAGGTFWRSRKEIKKRTLFVGNLPAGSSPTSITDLVDSVVSSNSLDASGPVVEKVDLIKGHARARVTHAFVTFRTAGVSEEAQRLLDGLQVGSTFLRVNGAADKQQRAEAISRRQGGVGAGFSGRESRRIQ